MIHNLKTIEILMKKKEPNTIKKINKLPVHEKLQKLNLNDVTMDFDATSLYTSAIWDENSVFPKIKKWICF